MHGRASVGRDGARPLRETSRGCVAADLRVGRSDRRSADRESVSRAIRCDAAGRSLPGGHRDSRPRRRRRHELNGLSSRQVDVTADERTKIDRAFHVPSRARSVRYHRPVPTGLIPRVRVSEIRFYGCSRRPPGGRATRRRRLEPGRHQLAGDVLASTSEARSTRPPGSSQNGQSPIKGEPMTPNDLVPGLVDRPSPRPSAGAWAGNIS